MLGGKAIVKYMGERPVPHRYVIKIAGVVYNPQGYIFGRDSTVEMSQAEADVLTGKTPAVVDEDSGNVITGFIVHADLGKDGLTGERWLQVWPRQELRIRD